ncbi:hypothetical protein, partial [Mesorhizobium sp. M7A.F.Ca.CA.002.04.1.1]|uniref:hypothetical protein n=1 Tax=Mesorhizobium sp. M7A.F.Ca.CA.002.04.1.1 TaxID=2496681 RepID=UPI0019D46CF7
VLGRGTLPADEKGNQADGNDDGQYEQGRHGPTPREILTQPPLRPAVKPGRGFDPHPGSAA